MARIERTLAEASRTLALHSNFQVPGPLDRACVCGSAWRDEEIDEIDAYVPVALLCS
jgi:hypothetical protein